MAKDALDEFSGAWDSLFGGSKNYHGPTSVDPSNYADQANNDFNQHSFNYRAQQAGTRTAPTLDLAQANTDYAQQQQDRTSLGNVAAGYQGVLDGTAPSVAQEQMRAGLQQAQQASEAQAASARGTNTIAAQRAATFGNAVAGQNAASNAALLRAQEVAAARSGQAGVYGQMAGLDQGSRAQSFQQAQQGVANQMSQQQLNDAATMSYLGMGQKAAEDKTAAGTAYGNAQIAAAQHAADQQLQADEKNKGFIGNAFSAVGGVLGGIL